MKVKRIWKWLAGKLPDGPTVVPIDPNGKYIVKLGNNVPVEEIEHLFTRLTEWIKDPDSDKHFVFLIGDGIELVKVDHDGEPGVWVCSACGRTYSKVPRHDSFTEFVRWMKGIGGT